MIPERTKEVEILVLSDNAADILLPGSRHAERPRRHREGEILRDTLLAEHGLSLLVTVHGKTGPRTLLFDTGYSPVTVTRNMDRLGVDPETLEAVVLSHGHMDHTGGLEAVLDRVRRPLQVVVHPGAFHHPRFVETAEGERVRFPRTLDREALAARRGVELLLRAGPVPVAGGAVLVTGEIPRRTSFERGMPRAVVEREGRLVPDTVPDDQALVVHLEGKGLVVITGCAHAGVVNTVLHARRLTGVDTVFAVLGGFHLSGPGSEDLLEPTLKALEEIAPRVIVPMHCTGWKAVCRLAEAFPAAFEKSGVGTCFRLP